MEFRLDAGQVELQQTVARFCGDRFPLDSIGVRERRSVDRHDWAEMAELGVFGLLLAEEAGGSGLGAIDGAIVLEQLGSYLAPGPIVWTVLSAGLVDGAATGDHLVGGVEADAVADRSVVVEHANDIDVLVVLHDDHVAAQRMGELGAPEALTPLDPLTPVGRVAGVGSGTRIGDAATAEHVRLLGTVLTAAMLVGVASRALDVARAYALERRQFDVPIGSFQAVKHLLADMYVRHCLAQSETYAAAAVVDDPDGDASTAAAAAKLLAADAASSNESAAVQILGGMGFTWDMLPNYLLKRARVLELSFGSGDEHAHALGSALVGR
jgi:alkylation response protein AidB-like acyl-CoA dehydrogenase